MKKIRFFLFVFVIIAAFQGAVQLWVFSQVQKRMGVKFSGNFFPIPFSNFFYLKNGSFEWENRVRLVSADLKCVFNYDFLFSNLIRLRISSQMPVLELEGNWQTMQGIQNVTLDRFSADLTFDRKGLSEIHSVDADSPTFQFHLHPSKNSERKLTAPNRKTLS